MQVTGETGKLMGNRNWKTVTKNIQLVQAHCVFLSWDFLTWVASKATMALGPQLYKGTNEELVIFIL